MASGSSRLDVDSKKQGIITVNHTQSDGDAYTYNMGVTTNGLMAIAQGNDPSLSTNQFITLEANSVNQGQKTITIHGNLIVVGNHLT